MALAHEKTSHGGNAETLHEYWVRGDGAKQIGWGGAGDFARCTRLLVQHAHMSPEQAHGYCNLAHKAATGQYPAQHAADEKASRSMGDYDADGLDSSWDDPTGLPDLTGLGISDFEAAAGGGSGASGLRSGRSRLS